MRWYRIPRRYRTPGASARAASHRFASQKAGRTDPGLSAIAER